MPEIQAFRGLRYDLGQVGSLSDVVAPPYDVISREQQDELYKLHPANVVRLILNREEPGDDENSRYARAARFLQTWRSEGVFQQDPDPALYVYHQLFEYGGQQHVRRGFMARVRLERFGEGRIFPHEQTHAAAKADRLKLTRACRANLSQIFGLYPDPDNQAQQLLEDAILGQTPLEAVDHLGVVHRMWLVTDLQRIAQVQALMSGKPLFIADGHHRYETACNYRDELAAAGPLDSNHPAQFVLTMCVGMSDPGMVVLPTHRLFRGLPTIGSRHLAERLGDAFDVEPAGDGPQAAAAVWEQIELEQDQGLIGFYAAQDRQWLLARLTEPGRQQMGQIAADHSADWQNLAVALLHRLVIDNLLGQPDLPKPHYVHLVEELIDGLLHGDPEDPARTPFPLAALVMPATVDHIRAISEHSERMPAKSTYFYPKLLSGLVLHPLE